MANGSLTEFHNHNGGIAWKLTTDGVFVENSGVERTPGTPTTVTRVWEQFHDPVNEWTSQYGVYCELILAVICTESSGNSASRRNEPGYVSDSATPGKVSLGLMQTLISTAREALNDPNIDGQWLLIPRNSIRAGTAYIRKQQPMTLLDPPKVACAYNAGGIHDNDGAENRWKMRMYPIGTSAHCDRFVKWFNDAVAALKTHATAPVRSLSDCFATL
jgi:soluble lytic murein transglycosylase-like protein